MANVDMKQVLKQLDELMERQQKMMERYQATSSLEAARSEPQEEPQSSTSVTPEQPVPDERHHVAIPAQETPEETNQARNVSIVSRKRRKPAVKGKPKTPKSPCWKCGDLHFARECPFASHICSGCQHQGHTEDFCPNNKPSTPQQPQPKRKFVTTELNGTAVKLQLDSASDITIISQDTWTSIGQPATQPTDESAITASGRTLNLLAEFHTEITNGGVTKRGRVFISENAELGILGIETMDLFELWSIPFSNMVNAGEQRPDQVVAQLKQQFPEVFRSTLGRCIKAQVKLYLKPDTCPTYYPKKPVA